jgi:hypothetical protein
MTYLESCSSFYLGTGTENLEFQHYVQQHVLHRRKITARSCGKCFGDPDPYAVGSETFCPGRTRICKCLSGLHREPSSTFLA